MIAYNTEWLRHLLIREQAEQALHEKCISEDEFKRIEASSPVGFYTPNIFVQLGLFILTVIIALFTLGLMFLLSMSEDESKIGILVVFFGLLIYAGLEIVVTKKHYKSGVDNALLWIAPVSILSGLNIMSDITWLENSIIAFILTAFLFIRFTNWIMAAVAAVAFIAIIFLSYTKLGEFAKASAPFVVMIVSAFIYLIAKRVTNKEKYKLYSYELITISIVALVCFYIAGNYFVVRETSIAMFNLDLKEGQSIPLGWLFWVLTFIIPVAYIIRGIQKKDIILLRVGMVLIGAIVFTVRYYYHTIPIEMAALIGGALLVAIAYALIRYLREPKQGFTYKKGNDPGFMNKLQIESLIIAETFPTTQQQTDTNFQFGGGSGGGAGASGEY